MPAFLREFPTTTLSFRERGKVLHASLGKGGQTGNARNETEERSTGSLEKAISELQQSIVQKQFKATGERSAQIYQRIMRFQQGRDAEALVKMITEEPVGVRLSKFFSTSSPMVSSAMRETVAGFLGSLPRDARVTYATSSEQLSQLSGMLIMTGYLFRNAEYVITLQQLLNIKSRTLQEYKQVFDEIDADGSGFIEVFFH